MDRAGVERFGLVGLELLDIVHDGYRKRKSYCATWNMLRIRYICLKEVVHLGPRREKIDAS